jgi:glycosyltransferase involved in cell wall biosynthesis
VRVCVVGSGTRFLSGISVYTNRLANALAGNHRVSVVLMRRLLPARLYPGFRRVGGDLDRLRYEPSVKVYDGVDWFWLPSMLGALWMLGRERPRYVVFQWWSGTVLHSYVLLAAFVRLLGGRVIVEFHESLDTAEERIPGVKYYTKPLAAAMLRLADGFAYHAKSEIEVLAGRYNLPKRPQAVLPHGPHDHYKDSAERPPLREAPADACNVLFFGVIRPYKGLEDLITAFDAMEPEEAERYWLTVVGETWEGWTLPAELIAKSRHRDRITFINRYVHDDEVGPIFEGSDVVALPYLRSAISGPVHVAMGYGKPLIVTPVGGLAESVEGYEGTVFVEPSDPASLREGLDKARALRGQRFAHPQSWDRTVEAFDAFFGEIEAARP